MSDIKSGPDKTSDPLRSINGLDLDELQRIAKGGTRRPWAEEKPVYRNTKTGSEIDLHCIGISGDGWGQFATVVTRMRDSLGDSKEGLENVELVLAAANAFDKLLHCAERLIEAERVLAEVEKGEFNCSPSQRFMAAQARAAGYFGRVPW